MVNHSRHWNLREVVNIEDKLDSIDDQDDRELARVVVKHFTQNVVGNAANLFKGNFLSAASGKNIIFL